MLSTYHHFVPLSIWGYMASTVHARAIAFKAVVGLQDLFRVCGVRFCVWEWRTDLMWNVRNATTWLRHGCYCIHTQTHLWDGAARTIILRLLPKLVGFGLALWKHYVSFAAYRVMSMSWRQFLAASYIYCTMKDFATRIEHACDWRTLVGLSFCFARKWFRTI